MPQKSKQPPHRPTDWASVLWVRSPIDPRAYLQWMDLTVEEAVAMQKKILDDPHHQLKYDRPDHLQQVWLEGDNLLHGTPV